MRLKYNKAAALFFVLIFIGTQLNIYAKTWQDTQSYGMEIDLVTGLGFMDGENSKQFFPDDLIDNAELVRIVMRLRNSSTGDRKQRFADVPPDYYAFAEIDEAVNLGYIPVGEGRMFYPEEKASFENALRLMLYVMNYKTYLDVSRANVITTAQEAGLLEGLSLSAQGITKGELAKLIYNSFFCSLMSMTGVRRDNKMVLEPDGDKTVLTYHGWKIVEGRITANEITSIYYSGNAAGRGCICIDGDEYREGSSFAGVLLGREVKAVCTDTADGDDTVIYAAADKKTNVLTVQAEDIVKTEGMTFYYGNNKKIKLKQDMCLIYNGAAVQFDSALLSPRYGDITFISADGSGSYDTVLINDGESYSVSGVSSSDGKIYLKNGTVGGKAYIDVNDEQGRFVAYFAGGERASLDSISTGSIITVYYFKDAREIITIYISDESVTGTLTGTGTEEQYGDPTAIFGGSEYIIGKNAVGTESFELGSDYTVNLDYKGYLIDVSEVLSSKNYAAVLFAGYDEAEDSCIVKLLKADGAIESFNTRNGKCRFISGRDMSVKTAKEMYNAIQSYKFTVILYELDYENRIVSITVPTAADRNNPLNNDGIFTKYSELTASTMAAYGSISGIGTASSRIFIIPPGDEIEYTDCEVRKGGYFEAGTSYSNAVFYDVGIDAQAGAVLVRAKTGSSISSFTGGIMVVSRTIKTVNSDNEPVTGITGYVSGQPVTLRISNNSVTDAAYTGEYDINSVSCGDILIYSTNSLGEISCYSVLYAENRDHSSFRQLCSLGNGYSTTRECSVYHAYTRYVSDKYLTIEYEMNTVPAVVSNTSNVVVYKVSRSGRSVEQGEYGDIKGANYYSGVNGSEIVLRTNRNGVVEVVIYED